MEGFQALVLQEPWFFYSVVTLLGCCIGSFLNVVIYRLPIMLKDAWQQEAKEILELPASDGKKFNLAFPPSACPCCKQAIKPWQNIPVLSFIFLRGKCAQCNNNISLRYPLVELATGVLSLLVAYHFSYGLPCLAMLLLTYVCIALFAIDYDHQLLPDCLTLPLLWLGLLLNTQSVFVSLPEAVLGAAVGYGFLWLIFWGFKIVTGKEGMGYGDFKLMAVFGAWFGWQILPNVILLSSLLGAVLGILMTVLAKRDSAKPMPFGPFIILAGWLTAMYPAVFTVTNYF